MTVRAAHIAATAMTHNQKEVENIANNLANQTTRGYKPRRLTSQDMYYQTLRKPGAPSGDGGAMLPSGLQLGLGVKTGSSYQVLSQGALEETKGTYDLAIQGNGYFQVVHPKLGLVYTRDGGFHKNHENTIVTSEGHVIAPGIVVPQDAIDIMINQDGVVSGKVPGSLAPQEFGRIELASFPNPSGLEAIGGNLFAETAASGTPTTGSPGAEGFGTVLQGYAEGSAVENITEVTKMIQVHRVYDMNSKVLQRADEIEKQIAQMA